MLKINSLVRAPTNSVKCFLFFAFISTLDFQCTCDIRNTMEYIVHGSKNQINSISSIFTYFGAICVKRIRRFDLLTTDLGHVLVVCDLTQIPRLYTPRTRPPWRINVELYITSHVITTRPTCTSESPSGTPEPGQTHWSGWTLHGHWAFCVQEQHQGAMQRTGVAQT